MIPFNLL